jgi:hypothetical protein
MVSGGILSILIGLSSFAQSSFAAVSSNTASLNLQSSQYVSSGQTYYRDDAGSSNSTVGVTVDLQNRWKRFSTRAFFKDEYSGTEKWNYLNLYELKAVFPFGKESNVIAGRHLDTWAVWDDLWRLGVFQPRYTQNKMRPETAGLTGFYLIQKNKSQSLTLGVLPVYIPDLGAHFYVRNNKFHSENPWFNPPASQFVFREEVSDIHYSVDMPNAWHIIANPGLISKYEANYGPYSGRLTGAYKPVQQVMLGFPSEGRMVVGEKDDYMMIDIAPKVIYSRVVAFDNTLRSGVWTFYGGLAYEQPDDTNMPSSWTSQQVKPAWITSLGVTRPLEDEGPMAARISLSMLTVEGGDARDKGEFAGDVSLFEPRYQYLEAYRLGFSKPWRGIFKFPLDTEVAAIYDRKQNGGSFSFSSGLNYSKELRFSFEADFLGLLGTKAEVSDRFFSMYRANDRVGLGMSYVY